MISIAQIRESEPKIVVLGNHPQIIQSILDFDYLAEKNEPSVISILGNSQGVVKYFWGRKEILLPVKKNLAELKFENSKNIWFLNLLSGRRSFETFKLTSGVSKSLGTVRHTPEVCGGVFFAENIPERHAQALYQMGKEQNLFLVGPASVGLLIPGVLKLGPIGGVTPTQISEAGILKKGNCAVISASGGMTNELINMVRMAGSHLSFAFSTGGDRFPLPTLKEAFLLAEADPLTKLIVYYGELGGEEEYELIELKKAGKLTKPVVVHISGTVASLFKESPQFGHAKAKATSSKESAQTKRAALKAAGFRVSFKFAEVLELIKEHDKY